MKMTEISTTTAGIDTSKLKLDIAVHGGTERWQVANASPGWRTLAANLAKACVTRVGIEATGGYERGVVEHLRAVGFIVLVLQPIQVKAYARMHLRRAKNDALDAVLIAACAAAIEQPRIAPDPRLMELAGYLTFLEQIEEDIARFKTRLEHIDAPRLRRLVTNDIARLKGAGVSDALIGALIRANAPPPTRVVVEPQPRVVYVEPPAPPPQVVVVEEHYYPYNPWWFVYSERPGCDRSRARFGIEYVGIH